MTAHKPMFSSVRCLMMTVALMTVFAAQVSALDFDDLNIAGNNGSEPARTGSPRLQSIVQVSLSERLLNSTIAKYVSPSSPLRQLYVALRPNGGGMVIRGVVTLPADLAQGAGLSADQASFAFQSAVRIRVTSQGYLAFVFPHDATTVWSASVSNPATDQRVRIPTEFLSIALSSVRCHLAALSGDFSAIDRRIEAIEETLAQRRQSLPSLTGPARAQEALAIDELAMKGQALAIKRRRLVLMAQQQDKLVQFLGEREYNLAHETLGVGNGLLFRLKLEQMFPFLAGVQIGQLGFTEVEGQRYLVVTIDALTAS